MHALEVRLRDERADVRRLVEGVADAQSCEGGREALEELGAHGLVHEEARGGEADLAVLERDPHDRVSDGGVEVGVLADHERALAAQLEQRGRDVLGDARQDPSRGRDAACEGDLGDAGRGDERGAGLRPEAGDDVDDAVGQEVPDAARELDDARRRPARTA